MRESTSRSSTVTPTSCATCGAERELVRSGVRTAARCAACGTVEDVEIVCAPREKWTLVAPDGSVRTFTTRAEALASEPSTIAAAPAVATDTPAAPAAKSALDAGAKGALETSLSEPPKSADGESVLSVRDLTVIAMPKIPPTLSKAPPVPPAASASPPPLPAKPRLKTLAPPTRHDAPPPPPPSIDITGLESVAPAASVPPPAAKANDSVAAKTVAAKDEEPPARGWLLPGAAVALVAGAIVFALRSAPANDSRPAAPAPDAAVAPTLVTTTSSMPSMTASVAPAPSASATTATVTEATPPPPIVEKLDAEAPKPAASGDTKASDAALPLAELLNRASAARRSGDSARAKTLLDQALVVSPGNVEAFTGLGDLARSKGDLVGAKASYERALATSPTYSAALLGLADAEWDLGNRANAQRHYKTLVQNASSPPERARTRAAVPSPTTSAAAVATPTATVRPLTSADLPPPVTPKSP